jgi:septal ring factor EnvC (AmiA/AmiB activator)
MAPDRVVVELEGEIQVLGKSLEALKAAVTQAAAAREDTKADLTRVQRRLAAKTAEALPDDEAIRDRLDAAVDSAFTAARNALTARWTEIVRMLNKACATVEGEKTEKERRLAQRHEELEQERRQRVAAG